MDNIAIKIDKRLAVEVDDTARLQRAIDNATSVKTLLISEEFVITSLKLKDNIYIKQNGGYILFVKKIDSVPNFVLGTESNRNMCISYHNECAYYINIICKNMNNIQIKVAFY